jgi:hypothetical protein
MFTPMPGVHNGVNLTAKTAAVLKRQVWVALQVTPAVPGDWRRRESRRWNK